MSLDTSTTTITVRDRAFFEVRGVTSGPFGGFDGRLVVERDSSLALRAPFYVGREGSVRLEEGTQTTIGDVGLPANLVNRGDIELDGLMFVRGSLHNTGTIRGKGTLTVDGMITDPAGGVTVRVP